MFKKIQKWFLNKESKSEQVEIINKEIDKYNTYCYS